VNSSYQFEACTGDEDSILTSVQEHFAKSQDLVLTSETPHDMEDRKFRQWEKRIKRGKRLYNEW
jgi:hypothetical protein